MCVRVCVFVFYIDIFNFIKCVYGVHKMWGIVCTLLGGYILAMTLAIL